MEDNGKDIWANSTTAISFSSSNGGSVPGFADTVFICGELFILIGIIFSHKDVRSTYYIIWSQGSNFDTLCK
jgi:hypothetical protein